MSQQDTALHHEVLPRSKCGNGEKKAGLEQETPDVTSRHTALHHGALPWSECGNGEKAAA